MRSAADRRGPADADLRLLAGLLFGLYFSLIGLGLNLVFGVMRIVNLAHGDFLMLGAYCAFWLYTLFGLDPVFAIPVAFALFPLIGLPLYYVLVPRLLARAKIRKCCRSSCSSALARSSRRWRPSPSAPSERSIPGGELGASLRALIGNLTGHEIESGPVEIFGQSFPSAWIVSRHRQPDRRRMLVYLYLYRTRHRLSHARGDARARRSAGDRHRRASRVGDRVRGRHRPGARSAACSRPSCSARSRPRWASRQPSRRSPSSSSARSAIRSAPCSAALFTASRTCSCRAIYQSWANLLPYILLIGILLVRPSGPPRKPGAPCLGGSMTSVLILVAPVVTAFAILPSASTAIISCCSISSSSSRWRRASTSSMASPDICRSAMSVSSAPEPTVLTDGACICMRRRWSRSQPAPASRVALALVLTPLFRLSGAYFSIANLAASLAVLQFVSNPNLETITKARTASA